MHLVFLNQYYPPDAAPTGVMLQAVAEECARQGHAVTVICADGGYAGGEVKAEIGKAESRDENPEFRIQTERGIDSASSSSTLPNQKSTIHNHQSEIRDQGPGMIDQEQAAAESSAPSSNFPLNSLPPTSPPQTFDSSAPTLTERRYKAEQNSEFNIQHSLPTIVRLPATRFGRGTFVGKLMDYASYYVGVAWQLGTMDPPPDRIVALTTPPYLSVLARAVSKLRGADHAHWVMDLYPDVMVAHGMLAEGGWKHRLLAGIARWGFGGRRCAAILTLGPDMAERVGRHREEVRGQGEKVRGQTELEIHSVSSVGPSHAAGDKCDGHRHAAAIHTIQKSEINKHQSSISPVSWVPLWGGGELPGARVSSPAEPMAGESAAREEPVASSPGTSFALHRRGESGDSRSGGAEFLSLREDRGWADDELVVMYSGNMGLGHRFGEILELAGARVSRPAEPMESERAFPGEPVASFQGTSFALHRRGESGDSRSGEVSSAASTNRQSTVSNLSVVALAKSDPQSSISSSSASPSTLNSELLQQPNDGSSASTLIERRYKAAQPTALQNQRFVFYGGGKRRREIEAFIAAHPGAPVELHDYAPADELAAHLMTADVHLVSLEPAWTGTMVPSKLQGIFAVGRPVVFIGSAESSIGRWVEESGGGWVVVPGDVDGLRAALEEARDPVVRRMRGEAAARFSSKCFDRETNVRRVVEVLAGD